MTLIYMMFFKVHVNGESTSLEFAAQAPPIKYICACSFPPLFLAKVLIQSTQTLRFSLLQSSIHHTTILSKMSFTEDLCRGLWGSDDCSWAFLPSVGNSGGIVSIWRKSESNFLFSFVGEGFVGVCLEWGRNKELCFVVNIYSKCDLPAKRRLWDNLALIRNTFGMGAWWWEILMRWPMLMKGGG
jgi:hypothetical protein